MKRVQLELRMRILLIFAGLLQACASGYLKYEKAAELKQMDEFEQAVKIEAPEETKASPSPEPAVSPSLAPSVSPTPESKKKKPTPTPTPAKKAVVTKHEPELEGQAGFNGRRPLKDPFWVGEKVTHEVSYFNMKAGEMVLQVKPFALVNGRKNYHFHVGIKTASLFASFYEVDDFVSSLVDFEKLIPSVFTLHVKETSQLREARFFIDWQKNRASFWEKKVTKKEGPEETKKTWEVLPYTQDVFSAVFYMRVFPWEVGKENAFRVSDNGENLIFRGRAIKRERISTDAGDFDAIKIKPEIELKGQFKPVGDIFIWLSDDDRKLVLRIESKIKIGTLVSEVTKIERGTPDESQSSP